jgi:hypothetical protein
MKTKTSNARWTFRRFWMVPFFLAVASPVSAQEMPAEYREVLAILGRKGDFAENVLKVGIPRNDLKVTIAGISTPTSFGFGGWLAFTRGDMGMDVVMGDLVLLQEEVNPVLSALLENGFEVTALHNHFFWDEPRIFYMHVHGHGQALVLARTVKPALELIGHIGVPKTSAGSGAAETVALNPLDTERLNSIIGHKGSFDGQVYKVTVGRPDVSLIEMGATINARMGLNSWAAIVGSGEKAAIAGDIAMTEAEVNGVLKTMRKSGLDVVAIHHHMIGSRPMIIFLHYWGIGPVEKLAAGFRDALSELGKEAGQK